MVEQIGIRPCGESYSLFGQGFIMKNDPDTIRPNYMVTGIAAAVFLFAFVPALMGQPFVPQVPRPGFNYRPNVPTVPFSNSGRNRRNNNNNNNSANNDNHRDSTAYNGGYNNRNNSEGYYANQSMPNVSGQDNRRRRSSTTKPRENRPEPDKPERKPAKATEKKTDDDMAGPGKKKDPDEPRKTFDEQFDGASATNPIRIDHDSYITSDGVWLVADYYKGNADENTIPVLLLHGKGQSKENMKNVAHALAETGMAVLCPDFRGHGESTSRSVQDYTAGNMPVRRVDTEYTVENFQKDDYLNLVNTDGKFWYNFLIAQHNAKRINIRKLIVIGTEFGGSVASFWVRSDWSAPNNKRGRFARALILISPNEKECATSFEVIKRSRPGDSLGFLFFVGDMNEELLEEVKDLRNKVGGREKPDTPPEEKKAVIITLNTEKQGMEMVDVGTFKIPSLIIKFIEIRMERARPRDLAWQAIKFDEDATSPRR